MTGSTDKMTIKELADELGITKNTVRNYLVKAGYDLTRYKENGIIMLDKELIGVARSIYQSMTGQLTGNLTGYLPVKDIPAVAPSEREILFLNITLRGYDMKILISNTSDAPLYQQIKEQIIDAILKGELVEGDPLPSIRAFANDLKVSVLTIRRVYDDLEKEGFVNSQVGIGTFCFHK
ncbi:TPA: GntR family transcriptional regulator [Enterococcus faecium]|nr:GntR family transcriptional regulator [Enterococcus faecium]HBM4437269.1 GntR family transcriptional regulator [Enterococcus faecium]HBM4437274.1 GntR family transcriptional regulator [Enterococcus faecium]